MLTDMVIGLQTARLMTWKAAYESDAVCPVGAAGIAKDYATEMAVTPTDDAMQVLAGLAICATSRSRSWSARSARGSPW